MFILSINAVETPLMCLLPDHTSADSWSYFEGVFRAVNPLENLIQRVN